MIDNDDDDDDDDDDVATSFDRFFWKLHLILRTEK